MSTVNAQVRKHFGSFKSTKTKYDSAKPSLIQSGTKEYLLSSSPFLTAINPLLVKKLSKAFFQKSWKPYIIRGRQRFEKKLCSKTVHIHYSDYTGCTKRHFEVILSTKPLKLWDAIASKYKEPWSKKYFAQVYFFVIIQNMIGTLDFSTYSISNPKYFNAMYRADFSLVRL